MEIVSHLPVRTSKEMSVFCLLCPLSSYKCYPGSDGILPRWLPAAWCWWCWLSQSAVRAFTTIKWDWLGVATLRVNYHHFTDWSLWIRDYNMIGNQRAEHSQARLSHHWPANSAITAGLWGRQTTNQKPVFHWVEFEPFCVAGSYDLTHPANHNINHNINRCTVHMFCFKNKRFSVDNDGPWTLPILGW